MQADVQAHAAFCNLSLFLTKSIWYQISSCNWRSFLLEIVLSVFEKEGKNICCGLGFIEYAYYLFLGKCSCILQCILGYMILKQYWLQFPETLMVCIISSS